MYLHTGSVFAIILKLTKWQLERSSWSSRECISILLYILTGKKWSVSKFIMIGNDRWIYHVILYYFQQHTWGINAQDVGLVSALDLTVRMSHGTESIPCLPASLLLVLLLLLDGSVRAHEAGTQSVHMYAGPGDLRLGAVLPIHHYTEGAPCGDGLREPGVVQVSSKLLSQHSPKHQNIYPMLF